MANLSSDQLWLEEVLRRISNNDARLSSIKSEGRLLTADGSKALAEAIAKSCLIVKLDLAGSKVGSVVSPLIGAIQNNASIKILILDNVEVDNDTVAALSDILKSDSCNICQLSLRRCGLGVVSGKRILSSLKDCNKTMKRLDLSCNSLSSKFMRTFANDDSICLNLDELQLECNSFGETGIVCLCLWLRMGSSVKSLRLKGNNLRSGGAKVLGSFLKVDKTIENLSITNCSIGDEGALALCNGLRRNRSLRSLSLASNQISATSCECLAVMLNEDSSFIYSLDLRGNPIGDDGAKTLGRCLVRNSALRVIDIGDTGIGDSSMEQLIGDLKRKTSVNGLYTMSNPIGVKSVESIVSWMNHVNRPLMSLAVTNGRIGGKFGLSMIMDGIGQNCSLETFRAGEFGDDEAKELASKLKMNRNLTKLKLSKCKFGSEGVASLVQEGLKNNFYLKQVHFSGLEKDCDPMLLAEKDLYVRWNGTGRALLRDEDVPVSLWVSVLARSGRDPDVLFKFLQAKPDLMKKQYEHETSLAEPSIGLAKKQYEQETKFAEPGIDLVKKQHEQETSLAEPGIGSILHSSTKSRIRLRSTAAFLPITRTTLFELRHQLDGSIQALVKSSSNFEPFF